MGDDLEYTEDRIEQKQPALVKKNITLKLKSANVSTTPVVPQPVKALTKENLQNDVKSHVFSTPAQTNQSVLNHEKLGTIL